MAKNLLGVLIGTALDRRDGDSGVKSAVEGYVVESAFKVVLPLAVPFAVGWAAQRGIPKALHSVSSHLEHQRRGQALNQ
jgi:hypothetical protein